MYGRARVILQCRINGEEEEEKKKNKCLEVSQPRKETRINPRVVTKRAMLGGLHFCPESCHPPHNLDI